MRLYRLPEDVEVLSAVERYKKLPFVDFAEPNYTRQLTGSPDPFYSQQWSLNNTGQQVNGRSGPAGIDIRWPQAKALLRGQTPVTVAVVDSGIAIDHKDILLNAWLNSKEFGGVTGKDDDGNGYVDDFMGWDFFAQGALPFDENGHGTLVASIIAGTPDNGLGGTGVCPNAKVMALRVLNQFGQGGAPKFARVSDVTLALDYALRNGAKIVNLSLGGTSYSSAEYLMFQALAAGGVLAVAAAGNGGLDGIGDNNDNTPIYPASYNVSNMIAVAAQDRSGALAYFSNHGSKSVHIAAPGTDIFGADVTRRTYFSENFEGSAPGWKVGSLSGSLATQPWAIDTFGGNSFLTDRLLGATYAPNTNTWARSPLISLAGVQGARLTFAIAYDLADDWLWVEASRDGVTWLPYDFIYGTSLFGQIIYQREIDLSDFDGGSLYFRFRLFSDYSVQGFGVMIDDVSVSGVTTFDPSAPRFRYNDGTSFAAPIVAGVAALVMSQRPDLTVAQVKTAILNSARPITALAGKIVTAGMVDAEAALRLADSFPINVAPSISVQPQSQTVTAGQRVSLTVTASGTPTPTFQWKRNGTDIVGATNSTLTIAVVQSNDAGSYTVVATNAAGSVTSNAVTLTVSPTTTAPTITTQPTNQRVNAGGTVSFAGVASGSDLSYRWLFNGNTLTGATTATLTLSNVTSSQGGTYQVIVSNAGGEAASTAVTLTVDSVPTTGTGFSIFASEGAVPSRLFRVSPVNGTVTQISSLGFFPGLDFRSNGVLYGSSSSLSTVSTTTGASTSIGSLPELIVSIAFSPSDELYGVSNDGRTLYKIDPSTGRSLSSVALTGTTYSFGGTSVGEINGIDFAPDGRLYGIGFGLYLINPNTGVATRVTPGGRDVSGGLFTDLDFGPDGQLRAASWASTGTVSNLYTINPATGIGQLVGPMGARISGLATIPDASSSTAPVISTQPASLTVNTGQTASFTVAVSGTPPFTYQWRKDGTAISGATNATLTLTSVQSAQAGSYTVVVNNAAGSVTSNAATLTVNVPPVISTQPANLTVNSGQTATFSVVATGTPAPTYQWRKNGTNISGATGASYSIASAQTSDTGSYTVIITNAAGSATSNAATLTVNVPPVITTQPANLTVNSGQPATFSLAATGTPIPTFQWKKNGTSISGATNASYTITPAQAADAGSYTVVVTNAAGTATSNAAVLTVNVPPTFTTQPLTQTVNTGAGLTLTVAASGTGPFTYQWKKNGVVIAGATAATYTVSASQPADAGSYTVVVTNAAGSATSNAATVTINYSRISNLSVRTNVASGQTLIVGFVTDGAKPVLVRAVGPGMATAFPQWFPPDAVMADPKLELYNTAGTKLDENDNWSSSLASTLTSVGAFPLTAGSKDSAFVTSINGPHTTWLTGSGAGVVLVEAYDTMTTYAPRLRNVSARNQVGTGTNLLIAGFAIDGNTAKTVLIRGIGPALRDIWGLTTALVDPKLEVYSGSTKIAENDNWAAALTPTFDAVGAYRFTAGSKDAALLITLPPGLYTAQLSGIGGTTGEGVVEVYEVP